MGTPSGCQTLTLSLFLAFPGWRQRQASNEGEECENGGTSWGREEVSCQYHLTCCWVSLWGVINATVDKRKIQSMAKTDKGGRGLYSVLGLPFHVTGMCDALSSRVRGGIQDRKRHDGEE